MPNDRPPTIDPLAAERWATRISKDSPWLHEEVARRMESRLQWITQAPQRWLHWQPLQGGLGAHALLKRRYPKAARFLVEASPSHYATLRRRLQRPWWHPLRWLAMGGDIFAAPQQPVNMLWANMALHAQSDPLACIRQWHGHLAQDGFLMFSCFGPDTLQQIRAIYAQQGWSQPSHAFTDMHDWGDMLVQAGFAEPVMDMERITLSYSSPEALLAELRGLGRNLHVQRFPGLRGRGWRDALLQALQKGLASPEVSGRLALTFEIIYGHAFKPAPRLPVTGHSVIPLDDMRAALAQGRSQRGPSG